MTLQKLWSDEAGFIVSAELVLVATIVVIGMIVGLVTIRNQVVQELVDVGQAFGAMCQSYAYGAVIGHARVAFTCRSEYDDKTDFCQALDVVAEEPGGITIYVWDEHPGTIVGEGT